MHKVEVGPANKALVSFFCCAYFAISLCLLLQGRAKFTRALVKDRE